MAKNLAAFSGTRRLFQITGVKCALLFLFVATTAAQNPNAVDLRNQLAPIPEEQLVAAKVPIASVIDGGETIPFTVSLFIESVSPVSELTGNMTVNLSVRNTGRRALRIPVSLEMKVLHYEGNRDRRRLICQVKLSSDRTKEDTAFLGFMTFSSSTDTSSIAVISPGESLRLTFETTFQRPWETDAAKWKEEIRQGLVVGEIGCHLTEIEVDSSAPSGQRRYNGVASEVVKSNTVRLSIKP